MTTSERSPQSESESGSEFLTASAEETRALARRLAPTLRPGDVVLLVGELGAGKTTFVQGLAEGLGLDPQRVSSPTFVLIQEYAEEGAVPLYHVDAYRVRDPRELVEVGLEEYFERPGVTVIEWGDKVRERVPPDAIEVRFEVLEGDRRRIRIRRLQRPT